MPAPQLRSEQIGDADPGDPDSGLHKEDLAPSVQQQMDQATAGVAANTASIDALQIGVDLEEVDGGDPSTGFEFVIDGGDPEP